MSLYSRSIRKIRRQCNIFKLNADAIIDNIYIFSVHQIPLKIEYGQSFDFWIIEPNNCYLLDIEKAQTEK